MGNNKSMENRWNERFFFKAPFFRPYLEKSHNFSKAWHFLHHGIPLRHPIVWFIWQQVHISQVSLKAHIFCITTVFLRFWLMVDVFVWSSLMIMESSLATPVGRIPGRIPGRNIFPIALCGNQPVRTSPEHVYNLPNLLVKLIDHFFFIPCFCSINFYDHNTQKICHLELVWEIAYFRFIQFHKWKKFSQTTLKHNAAF